MEIYNGPYCVYIHTNKINGKMYVGQTIYGDDPNKRWKNGTAYRNSPHFWNAIQKHGWDNFEHEVVASHLTLSEANHFEELLIAILNTMDPDVGYNAKSGGENNILSEETKKRIGDAHRGIPLSDETKKKLSEIRKGRILSEEHKRKLSAAQKGKNKKPLSEEHKKHLSEAQKGKTVSEETRRKISESERGKTVSTETRKKLSEAQKGKKASEETKRKLREIQAYRKKPINQYDKNGNLIQRWDSMRDAAYALNINEQNISACCRHVLKTAYGFVWEYADNMQT